MIGARCEEMVGMCDDAVCLREDGKGADWDADFSNLCLLLQSATVRGDRRSFQTSSRYDELFSYSRGGIAERQGRVGRIHVLN